MKEVVSESTQRIRQRAVVRIKMANLCSQNRDRVVPESQAPSAPFNYLLAANSRSSFFMQILTFQKVSKH